MPRPKPKSYLLEVRTTLKLTQMQMSELLCCTQAAISTWETNDAVPPLVRKFLELYVKDKRPTRARKAAKRAHVKAVLQGVTSSGNEPTTTE